VHINGKKGRKKTRITEIYHLISSDRGHIEDGEQKKKREQHIEIS
jgi:hypothetical protein